MSDLLRLLMIAVIGFVIVGVAAAYTRDTGIPDHSTVNAVVVHPPQLQFSVVNTNVALTDPDTRIWIPRPRGHQWMGLAGFPDSTEVRFAIPAGISFSSGSLELKFDVQMGNDGDGRMTIGVNGRRRGEVVLDAGRSRHDVRIDLDANDVLGDAVVVTLEGRGTLSGGQICPVNATNSGAAITLLPESGLALLTNDPKDTVEVRIATLTDPMTLAQGSTVEEQAVSLWALQALNRRGATVRLANDDLAADLVAARNGESALAVDSHNRLAVSGAAGIDFLLDHRLPAHMARSHAIFWPIPAQALGAEVLVKNFRGSRRWTIPYKLADLEHGRMPGLLELHFKTSLLAPGNHWMVRVSLNDHLLRTERFDGKEDLLSMTVELPEGTQTLENTILAELIDTSPNETVCSVPPSAQAQLLPSTTVAPRAVQPDSGWPEMVEALAGMDTIGLQVAVPLSRAQASAAAAALSRFLPVDADIAFAQDALSAPARIDATTAGRLRSALREPGKVGSGLDELWLVVPGKGTDPVLSQIESAHGAPPAIKRLSDDAVVLTISRSRHVYH